MGVYCKECFSLITRGSISGFCKSCSHKGDRNHLFGKHLSEQTKHKLSKIRIEKKLSKGSNNPNYKGAKPYCKDCGAKISWQRKRCSTCHTLFLQSRTDSKNPNWKNGISFLPYDSKFNKNLKEKIKIRDNYICQECGTDLNLSIHHIDYDKNNNIEENLITLCFTCNSKANARRPYWKEYFNVKNRQNY